MSTRKLLPSALLGAAMLAFSGTAAVAQSSGDAPVVSSTPAISQPVAGPHGRRERMERRGRRNDRHPELKRAWRALSVAEQALDHAAHTFDGHRAKALELVRQAKAELKAAAQASENK